MKRTVVRADQSPMNERRWQVTFDCGHEQWVTAKKRPVPGRKLVCSACKAKGED